MKIDVKDFKNAKVETITVSKDVFGAEARQDILHRVVQWQLAKRRSGNHKTKGISEISGTGKKPWKQKGTGRARAGSLRQPQMRGGATIFGPVVRDHSHSLPKKVRALGLKCALSAKQEAGELIVLDSFEMKSGKTKDFLSVMTGLELKSALFVDADAINEKLVNATSNVIGVDVLPHQGLNVYDILRREKLVMTKAALEKVESRLK